MAEKIYTLAVMHTDHRHWKNENDAWRIDIRRWQEEDEAVLTALDLVRKALVRRGEAVKTHAASINAHEAALDLHERAMVQYENEGKTQRLHEVAMQSHQQQAIQHLDRRQAHERLKGEQPRLAQLLEILTGIMHERTAASP